MVMSCWVVDCGRQCQDALPSIKPHSPGPVGDRKELAGSTFILFDVERVPNAHSSPNISLCPLCCWSPDVETYIVNTGNPSTNISPQSFHKQLKEYVPVFVPRFSVGKRRAGKADLQQHRIIAGQKTSSKEILINQHGRR